MTLRLSTLTKSSPWVRIVSCHPGEVPDADIPPAFSGLPTVDRSGWNAHRREYRRVIEPLQRDFDEFCRQRGAPALPALAFIHESPWLNLYAYPKEVDYLRHIPLGPSWHNVGSSVRASDGLGRCPIRSPPEMVR